MELRKLTEVVNVMDNQAETDDSDKEGDDPDNYVPDEKKGKFDFNQFGGNTTDDGMPAQYRSSFWTKICKARIIHSDV